MEHLLHTSLIFGGFLLGLLIWFWDSLISKRLISLKSLVLLFVLIFSTIHASPFTLLEAYHHQSQDQTTHHPCCMPQLADLPVPITLHSQHQPTPPQPLIPVVSYVSTVIFSFNTRAPPSVV